MRQASDRWKLVDCGSTVAASAIRIKKNSCSATAAISSSATKRSKALIAVSCQRGAQLGQHLRRGRANTAPVQECLGRLLHKHPQSVARHGAMPARPVQKTLGRGAVHHVV